MTEEDKYKEDLLEKSKDCYPRGIFITLSQDITVYKIIQINCFTIGLCTLIIPKDSKVFMLGTSCRSNKATVQNITKVRRIHNTFVNTDKNKRKGKSYYDPSFKYKVGNLIIPEPKFSEIPVMDTSGIHFYLHTLEALDNYNYSNNYDDYKF